MSLFQRFPLKEAHLEKIASKKWHENDFRHHVNMFKSVAQ